MKKTIALLLGAVLCTSACLPALAACGEREEPHDHNVAEWTQTKAPTCTLEGEESGVCSICNETVTRPVDALGHEWVHSSYIKTPTCTEGGREKVSCVRGDATDERDVPAKGHTILDKNMQKLISSATCTEAGLRIVYCPDCQQAVEDVLPALGHTWTHVAYETEPTCTEGGVEAVVCGRCEEEGTRDVAALGHDWNSYFTVEKAATFDEAGSKYRACSRCDARNEVTPIPKLDPNEPTQYQFRLVRTNGDLIKFSDIRYEIFDETNTSVGTGAFRNGAAIVPLLPKEYTVKLVDGTAPKGYTAQASYTVSWQNPVLDVTLTASLIMEQPDASTKYVLNSVMNDFTIQTLQTNAQAAETLTLSGLLETHEIVVFNFWDTSCAFCEYEFPGLEAAYKDYADKVALIAIDDPDGMNGIETERDVQRYFNDRKLTFPVAMDIGLAERFGVEAYPVTIVIDREGAVGYIHDGALVNRDDYDDAEYSAAQFKALFERFLAD